MGDALPAPFWYHGGDEYPSHHQPALAALARAGEPLPGAGDFVLRMGGYQAAEDADLVRPGAGPAAILLCRHLDAMDRYTGDQGRTGDWGTSVVWFPDDGAEHRGATDPSQSYASDPDDGGGNGDVADGTLAGSGANAKAADRWGTKGGGT